MVRAGRNHIGPSNAGTVDLGAAGRRRVLGLPLSRTMTQREDAVNSGVRTAVSPSVEMAKDLAAEHVRPTSAENWPGRLVRRNGQADCRWGTSTGASDPLGSHETPRAIGRYLPANGDDKSRRDTALLHRARMNQRTGATKVRLDGIG